MGKLETMSAQQTAPSSPVAKYPVPFAGPKDCIFALPDRSNETIKVGRDGKSVSRLKPIGEITIPIMGQDGKASDAAFTTTVWRSRQDTPEGEQETISFSVPRQIVHTYTNLPPKSDEYYEARDVFNGWRGEVLDAFLHWQGGKESRQNVGGQVVRLVKKS